MKIPNLPYCEFPHRGPSTQFNESFHIFNSDKEIQLNVIWRNQSYTAGAINDSDEGIVSVGLFDQKEKNPWKTHKTIRDLDKHFSIKKLNEIMKENLGH
jgi:hypothetical protein